MPFINKADLATVTEIKPLLINDIQATFLERAIDYYFNHIDKIQQGAKEYGIKDENDSLNKVANHQKKAMQIIANKLQVHFNIDSKLLLPFN
jgi:hypothetical protein